MIKKKSSVTGNAAVAASQLAARTTAVTASGAGTAPRVITRSHASDKQVHAEGAAEGGARVAHARSAAPKGPTKARRAQPRRGPGNAP